MSGGFQRANCGARVSGAVPCDDVITKPVIEDSKLRRSCRECLDALRAWAAFNNPISSAGGAEQAIDGQQLAIARKKTERALQELRSLHPSCAADFEAKFEVLLALEDWLGQEDVAVEFAFELAREAYAFFSDIKGSGSERLADMSGGLPRDRAQSRFSVSKFLRLAGDSRPSIRR
jgi:hypothetical protein